MLVARSDRLCSFQTRPDGARPRGASASEWALIVVIALIAAGVIVVAGSHALQGEPAGSAQQCIETAASATPCPR